MLDVLSLTALLLVIIGFLAGVGFAALGPGGVFVTIGLYLLTELPTTVVAGTASLTAISMAMLGSVSYSRSGELDDSDRRETAVVLSVTGLVGGFVGSLANGFLPQSIFRWSLGIFVSLSGILVASHKHHEDSAEEEVATGTLRVPFMSCGADVSPSSRHGRAILASVGFVVGFSAGIVGVGGPIIAVPLLVSLDVILVAALATAQVQAVFITIFAATGYFLQGAISVPYALLIGVPELVGVLVGWKISHTIDSDRLELVIAALLLGLGPYIVLS
jgi:uncharacterized membrane protein YfcA